MSSAGNTRGLIEAQRYGERYGWRPWSLPRGIPAASLKRRVRCRYVIARHRLPRGIPAASLKPRPLDVAGATWLRSSAGNTRGLIEARRLDRADPGTERLPRGIPAASLKQPDHKYYSIQLTKSSAGNTRGLIEASPHSTWLTNRWTSSAGNTRGLIEARAVRSRGRLVCGSLPRGIPAASLKRYGRATTRPAEQRLPRGIPAASLKQRGGYAVRSEPPASSAGNTRGLIEAWRMTPLVGLSSLGLPRGIPAASLKHRAARVAAVDARWSSAGNTRGLIEASWIRCSRPLTGRSSAGNTRGLIEA